MFADQHNTKHKHSYVAFVCYNHFDSFDLNPSHLALKWDTVRSVLGKGVKACAYCSTAALFHLMTLRNEFAVMTEMKAYCVNVF